LSTHYSNGCSNVIKIPTNASTQTANAIDCESMCLKVYMSGQRYIAVLFFIYIGVPTYLKDRATNKSGTEVEGHNGLART